MIADIEAQYQLPEIATNSAKLNELGDLHKRISEELEKLYAEWEECAV